MAFDYLPDDLNRLWKELSVNPVTVSPENLRREERRLRSRVGLRNAFVTAVCCLIIAASCVFFIRSSTAAERIGALLSILGAANAMFRFLKRPVDTAQDAGATGSIPFYRAQLERQRDFHRGKGVLSWLLPILPGPIIFNVGFALDRPMLAPLVELQLAVFLVAAAIVVPLNLRVARKYQRRLDALQASER